MKVVINACLGGFGLSEAAIKRWAELDALGKFDARTEDRANPFLIQAIEELGDEANAGGAELKIITIPDDVEWIIEDYDGEEWVAEKHRTWGK